MKFFTVSLLAAISAASGSSLRGDDFQSDVVDNTQGSRNLQNCVARSTYLGCFNNRNNNRALPFEVDGRNHDAETCEAACADLDFAYFAREWRGQCFCSNESDYDMHGGTSGCDCCEKNVGANKMCVYMIGPENPAPGCSGNGSPSANYMGCFKNKNRDRALPYMVGGRRHSAKDCQDECESKGMKYFSREWKGQCFCSNDNDFAKHGSDSGCDCCGSNVGGNKMCVWQV